MILVRHGQSHFNVHFARTRQDPGIRDPALTEHGRRQAAKVADRLAEHDIRRLVVSPYTRTLETAAIIVERLALPVEIEPLVRERCYFTCDLGTATSELARHWPGFDFGHLAERWWPEPDEEEYQLLDRCARFRGAMAQTTDWHQVAVITHWGFIRGLTGREVDNCETVSHDPTAAQIAPAHQVVSGQHP